MILKTVLVGAAGSLLFSLSNKKIYSADQKSGLQSKNAIALIYPAPGFNVTGAVSFYQQSPESPTFVTARIKNLPRNGVYGFHIHQYGDLSGGYESVGPHFDPYGNVHGHPDDKDAHLGDLGNIKSDDNGIGYYTHKNIRISLYGHDTVLGRSVLIHRDEDDLGRGTHIDSKTTGHSGPRIAAGIIALSQELKNMPAKF